MAFQTKRITFAGANGAELAARLDLPAGPPKAYALFAHCFTCTKDIFAASRIAQRLSDRGIAVLRFDFTGLGASDGEFANTNFSSNVADLVAAADYMRNELEAPTILIGHSLGGAAVLAAQKSIPEIRAVSTIGAPADPAHVAHNFGCHIDEITEKGEAEVQLAGRPFKIQKQFLDDIEATRLEDDIQSLKAALLVFHAPMDETVSIDNAARIYSAAKHPKSFVSLEDADHLLTRKIDADYVADVLSAWAGRYLDNPLEEQNKRPRAVEGSVVVAETGAGKFINQIVTGSGHVITGDEPERVGGNNTGATPYDLLLAALGACKSMTMRMYADRKGYKLDRAEVRLRHDKIHAADCETCETEKGKVDQIKTEITIKGDLTDEERQKIFEIAEKCPVHRTITNELVIEAELK
ncbi:bifunctional alpha/beta hydrolase/OsmC family protein [Terasakiella sp. A23]|uniref:bifunctional alpha/beta hydrolase/OsmC family protein n=1 Tax=Terasakiella sp. FCG-A23 TaxID=3080561 RepID=UPI0029534F6C|nr:bifunctional alpha/beta hydrolase/OsmC family protein [Terasakiella sp. A23]MDV7340399.1 bifunctional alpha/beta hydrolase/OsmC family protein [Terasakiella sp. A23]